MIVSQAPRHLESIRTPLLPLATSLSPPHLRPAPRGPSPSPARKWTSLSRSRAVSSRCADLSPFLSFLPSGEWFRPGPFRGEAYAITDPTTGSYCCALPWRDPQLFRSAEPAPGQLVRWLPHLSPILLLPWISGWKLPRFYPARFLSNPSLIWCQYRRKQSNASLS